MKQSGKLNWILAAAISATLAGTAMAQYRVGTDGRALDANNRIGSGGINTGGGGRLPYGNIGNNIVTGNVTGGREFRGNVPYSDPNAFRGATAGGFSDEFIRNSSAAPYGGVPQNNAQAVRPFYGTSEAAPPPPGFVQQSIGSGAYIPAQPMARNPGDLRGGAIYNTPTAGLPQPGQLFLPGPVDPNTQSPTMISASPLYGVRQWNPSAPGDQSFLQSNLNVSTDPNLRFDPVTLQRLRAEVLQPDQTEEGMLSNQGENQQDGNQQNGNQQNNNQRTLNNVAPRAFEDPQNNALAAQLEGQSLSNTTVNANLATGATVRRRIQSPQQQSTQYAELQRRLQQHNQTAQALADARERTQNTREQVRAQNASNTAQQPGTPGRSGSQVARSGNAGAGGAINTSPNNPRPITPSPISPIPDPNTPGGTAVTPAPGGGTAATPAPANPGANDPGGLNLGQNNPAPRTDRPAPVQIKSLAEGVQAKGLAEQLAEAETQMKAGRYTSALEAYDLAEQIAPNNPLILLGRANAELGQGYYSRAERSLRQAYAKDQALLMGQVDLRSWLGTERLETHFAELRAQADREQKETTAVFLLAYIAYNTGNEARAAAYLDLAERRSEGKDELFPLLRRYWSLPQGTPENK